MAVSLAGDAVLEYVLVVEAAHGRHGVSVGTLGFLIGLPAVLGGALGSLLDRHRHRRATVLTASLCASAAATALLAAVWGDAWAAAVAYGVVVTLALLSLISTTVWQTLLPELAGRDRDCVKRVVGWTATVFAVGAALGPLMAATASTVLKPQGLILVDTATFIVCALLVRLCVSRLGNSALSPDPAFRASEEHDRRRWHGLRLLASEPLVRTPMLALSAMNFATFGVAFAVPLLVVDRRWPNSVIAMGSAVFVLGGLVGSLVATRFRSDRHFIMYVAAEPVVRAIGLVVVLAAPAIWVAVVGLWIFALPQGMGRVARQSFLITSFPGRHRGKVIGSYQMVVRGLMPLAPLVMQGVVDASNVDTYLVIVAAALASTTALVLADRSLRWRWRQAVAPVTSAAGGPA